MIADRLETAAEDKEDDYDLLDDKSPFVSLDFPIRSRRHTLFLLELLMLPILCL